MIKFVVFDLDGVLVDTVDLHFKSLNEALGQFAIDDSERHIYEGMRTVDKLNLLTTNKSLPIELHDKIVQDKNTIYLQHIRKLQPNYDVIDLLKALKQRNIKLAVCSNSNRECLDICLSRTDTRQYFDITLSSNDVSKHKPHPEIYLKALKLSDFEAYETVVIEDSEQGVQAAVESGCNVRVIKDMSEVNRNLLVNLQTGLYNGKI